MRKVSRWIYGIWRTFCVHDHETGQECFPSIHLHVVSRKQANGLLNQMADGEESHFANFSTLTMTCRRPIF